MEIRTKRLNSISICFPIFCVLFNFLTEWCKWPCRILSANFMSTSFNTLFLIRNSRHFRFLWFIWTFRQLITPITISVLFHITCWKIIVWVSWWNRLSFFHMLAWVRYIATFVWRAFLHYSLKAWLTTLKLILHCFTYFLLYIFDWYSLQTEDLVPLHFRNEMSNIIRLDWLIDYTLNACTSE